ncbi:MAG TPA: ATP-binding protein, partial [Planctomycetota bacterium]|nr:ATP-binding protein [Planctomycetota bacterium]
VNLISNAKHALEEKGADERVLEIIIAGEGSTGRIEVRDNGIGIAPENIGKIFNHGFTTKKTGHGFGLHNCANAAQQMEGRLDAFSEGRGHGARFVLRLPLPSPDRAAPRSGMA